MPNDGLVQVLETQHLRDACAESDEEDRICTV